MANQVTTTTVSARPSPTSPDSGSALNCENQTQRDYLRRIRGAWHAEGRNFEFSYSTSGQRWVAAAKSETRRLPLAKAAK